MKWKKMLKGAGAMAVCAVVAKLLGALYRIPLTNIAGAEGMGLYQMVFPLYTVLLTVSSGGLTSAISKVVAGSLAKNDERGALKILRVSTVSLLVISGVAAAMVFVLRGRIAALQGNSEASLAYLGIAPAVVLVAVISSLRGYFQGHGNMLPSGISQIAEQLFKLVFGLYLAARLLPRGVEYAVFGAVLGVTLSELAAAMYLFFQFLAHYFRQKKRTVVSITELSRTQLSQPQMLANLNFETAEDVVIPSEKIRKKTEKNNTKPAEINHLLIKNNKMTTDETIDSYSSPSTKDASAVPQIMDINEIDIRKPQSSRGLEKTYANKNELNPTKANATESNGRGLTPTKTNEDKSDRVGLTPTKTNKVKSDAQELNPDKINSGTSSEIMLNSYTTTMNPTKTNALKQGKTKHENANKLKLSAVPPTPLKTAEILRMLYKIAIPVTLGSLIMPLTQVIDSVMVINVLVAGGMTRLAATSLFGLVSGPINSLVNMPVAVTLSISVALLPKIAFVREKGGDTGATIAGSMRLMLLLSLPAATVFMAFPRQIVTALYSRGLSEWQLSAAASLLRIESLSVLYIGIIQVCTSVLQGADKPHRPALNLLCGALVKVLLTLALLPFLGIRGAAAASVFCYGVIAILGVFYARKVAAPRLNLKKTLIMPLAACAVLVLATFGALFVLSVLPISLSPTINNLVAIAVGGVFYAAFLFVSKTVTTKEFFK